MEAMHNLHNSFGEPLRIWDSERRQRRFPASARSGSFVSRVKLRTLLCQK